MWKLLLLWIETDNAAGSGVKNATALLVALDDLLVWSAASVLDPERALSHGLNEIRPVHPLSFFTVPSFCGQVVLWPVQPSNRGDALGGGTLS